MSMSKQEFDQLETLLEMQSGRLRVADARMVLGRLRRQVFRLLRGMERKISRAYAALCILLPLGTLSNSFEHELQ